MLNYQEYLLTKLKVHPHRLEGFKPSKWLIINIL